MVKMKKDSVVTITGGTGSFGQTMAKSLLAENVREIRIFSRDETKQELMRNSMRDERLRFFIGDVRDSDSVSSAIRGSNYVFHAAALKQVPSCEFFPMQAVATNVTGSSNVIEAAVRNDVESVVCLSTDKAVYPINAMGMSKAMMEKVAQSFARSRENSGTRISITRYGNVMMSRGSVIPLFLEQIKSGNSVTVTNTEMTRFLMSLDESVDLVKYAFAEGNSGDLFVRKAPASTVSTLISALSILTGNKEIEVKDIGIRHGEKQHESLVSSEEMMKAVDCGDYFRIPLDTRSLDYQIYFNQGTRVVDSVEGYTSANTVQLTAEQVAKKIAELPQFKEMYG
ncbi:COG1086 Predicted nucleoside-diphosphate sugar epimerases [Candidatus Nanopelagicaceae bacterium]